MVLAETIMGVDTFWLWLGWLFWVGVVVVMAVAAVLVSCWTTSIGVRLLRILDRLSGSAGRGGGTDGRE